jgi:cell division protein FtsI (penicillin-binding protein 3)
MKAPGQPNSNPYYSNVPQPVSAPVRRLRFLVLAGMLALWMCLIAGKLVLLQVFEHHHYMVEAEHQQMRTFEVAPRRGVLYDRNLHELATTMMVDSVYAVPSELHDNAGHDNKEQAAEILSEIVHQDGDPFTTRERIEARINASRNFAWIARKLDPETAERVRQMQLKGIYFQKEFKRFYPDNELAAGVLGYVGTDDTGLSGLELQFDDEMHGVPGQMLTMADARRHTLASTERDPEPGEDLVLTIDQNIQFIAERALDEELARDHAIRGTAVVMDPHTGEVLALAMRPTFNPNDVRHVDKELLTNPAVSNIYEPGSTFKLVTYSAALDSAGVKPDDIVDCQGGSINLYGRIIHDDKSDIGIGKVTVQRALERSSDVGAVKMALKVGNEKFYDYMRGFGFGQRTGIELPYETHGLLRAPHQWSATSIGSLAIGQEVGVTPVQLAAMVSAIANGGTYLPPHILAGQKSIVNGKLRALPLKPGDGVPNPLPDGAHRVISEMTSAQMRKMMEGIVLNGTGKEAALNGYSSGGKTGTAQKIDIVTHTYSKTKHVASFAGVAPISNPAITVAVVIDSPQGASYYGGAVSAPVFAQIAQQTLEYLGVPYDREVRPVKSKPIPTQIAEETPAERVGDQNALFAGISDLPKDDPIRAAAEHKDSTDSDIATASGPSMKASPATSTSATLVQASAVRVNAGQPVAATSAHPVSAGMVLAPALIGKPVRAAMETLMAQGLHLQALGSGVARAQSPPPGTPLAPGAQVLVRFSR